MILEPVRAAHFLPRFRLLLFFFRRRMERYCDAKLNELQFGWIFGDSSTVEVDCFLFLSGVGAHTESNRTNQTRVEALKTNTTAFGSLIWLVPHRSSQ